MSRGSNAVIEEDPWGDPAEILSWMWLQGRYDQCVNVDLDTDTLPLVAPEPVAVSPPHPAGVTAQCPVRCQVSGRDHREAETRDNTHMSWEHGHNSVARLFSKDSKYQHNTHPGGWPDTSLTEEEWVCWDVGMKTVFLSSFYCRDLFSVYCW